MQVKELMAESVVNVTQDSTAEYAARLMARHNVGSLPVCDGNGKLRGVVTDRDIVTRCIAAEADPMDTQVREIMSRAVVTASPGEDLRLAARKMSEERIRRLPVVENGTLVGMLSLGDLARNDRTQMEASRALSEISSNLRRL